jgi:hypothetical protein
MRHNGLGDSLKKWRGGHETGNRSPGTCIKRSWLHSMDVLGCTITWGKQVHVGFVFLAFSSLLGCLTSLLFVHDTYLVVLLTMFVVSSTRSHAGYPSPRQCGVSMPVRAVTARSPSALPEPQLVRSDATRSTPLAHGPWLGFVVVDPLDCESRSEVASMSQSRTLCCCSVHMKCGLRQQ